MLRPYKQALIIEPSKDACFGKLRKIVECGAVRFAEARTALD
jgi:hypothetical protein